MNNIIILPLANFNVLIHKSTGPNLGHHFEWTEFEPL